MDGVGQGQLWGLPPSSAMLGGEDGLGAAWTGCDGSSLVCIKLPSFWFVGRGAEQEPRPSREHTDAHKQNLNSVGLNSEGDARHPSLMKKSSAMYGEAWARSVIERALAAGRRE